VQVTPEDCGNYAGPELMKHASILSHSRITSPMQVRAKGVLWVSFDGLHNSLN
jgi:hypothetical protein